jgi:hypothetical protein
MRARLSFCLFVSVAFLLACPQRAALWVVPGATVRHLEFGVARDRGGSAPVAFNVFTVERCAGSGQGAFWTLSSKGRSAKYPTRIVFGQAPPGYVSYGPVGALAPGCYRAWIPSGADVEFTVQSDGHVSELREE